MRATSGWRTTSRAVKKVKLMPSTPRSTSRASFSPDFWCLGRSIWVRSPVTTAVEP